jgi:hypothetical protein
MYEQTQRQNQTLDARAQQFMLLGANHPYEVAERMGYVINTNPPSPMTSPSPGGTRRSIRLMQASAEQRLVEVATIVSGGQDATTGAEQRNAEEDQDIME